jgi:MYXO-CTERM domain-containing protein
VDQSQGGWTLIGKYDFAAGGDQWVRLEDNTGEALTQKLKIVSDAVRFTPEGTTPSDAGADTAPVADAKGDALAADAAQPGSDAAHDDAGKQDAGTPSRGFAPQPEEGCSCSTPGRSRTSAPWLLLLAALLRARK